LFECIWYPNDRVMKEIKNIKEKQKKQKKGIKGSGDPFQPSSANGPRPILLKTEMLPSSPPYLADRWAPPIGLFFNLPTSPAAAHVLHCPIDTKPGMASEATFK
jgi:hypothetical protein